MVHSWCCCGHCVVRRAAAGAAMSDHVIVTIAVPAAHIADANELARCLGYSAADGESFGTAAWQDGEGHLYAVASGPVRPTFVSASASPLADPLPLQGRGFVKDQEGEWRRGWHVRRGGRCGTGCGTGAVQRGVRVGRQVLRGHVVRSRHVPPVRRS